MHYLYRSKEEQDPWERRLLMLLLASWGETLCRLRLTRGADVGLVPQMDSLRSSRHAVGTAPEHIGQANRVADLRILLSLNLFPVSNVFPATPHLDIVDGLSQSFPSPFRFLDFPNDTRLLFLDFCDTDSGRSHRVDWCPQHRPQHRIRHGKLRARGARVCTLV
jgi:hypothetical protein